MSATPGKGPLVVRLCNWVGEAVLSLPTLTLLAEQGYELHLVGKRWAINLFEGHGWQVYVRPAKRSEAIRQLRELRKQLAAKHPGFTRRPNTLLFTSSFSSALEARLAGLKPIGYQIEGRSLLLGHGVPHQPGLHAADHYWRIGTHFTGATQTRPPHLGLKPSATHLSKAAQLVLTVPLRAGFIILCPFSGAADTTGKKLWPPFPELARKLQEQGHDIVLCPGPGETAQAMADYPSAIVINDIDLGTYAALSQLAACTVSNDTGPGHLAAAAGAHVVSVLGPDAAPMWWIQGEKTIVLHPAQGWPAMTEVLRAIETILNA